MPSSPPASRPSLLLVDDEASIRSALRRYLERRGWLVDEAPDGAVALRKLLGQDPPTRFDVVLCDMKMPGVNGMEMYAELLREAPAIARRVIFSTGDASAADVAGFLATVTAPVLEKPFGLADVEALARKVLAATAGDDGHPETAAPSDG
jgi:CheY-like chemotaxis protein